MAASALQRTFREAVREREFVIAVELPLQATRSGAELEQQLDDLRPVVDAVQLGAGEDCDNCIAPLAAAAIAIRAGIDPIVHVSSRDRNRIALQNDLLGAYALGVTSIILRRGEKLPAELRRRVKGVFDTKSTQLLTMAHRLAEGARLIDPHSLYPGSLVAAIRPPENWEASLVTEKLDQGARFLQTRPCTEPEVLRDYAARLIALRITHRAALIAGIPLLTSIRRARSLSDSFPGATVPDVVLRRLADAKESRREGVAILAEMLTEAAAAPGISGAAVVHVDDTDAVAEAITLADFSCSTG